MHLQVLLTHSSRIGLQNMFSTQLCCVTKLPKVLNLFASCTLPPLAGLLRNTWDPHLSEASWFAEVIC